MFVLIVTIFVSGADGKALSASGFSAGPFATLAACESTRGPFTGTQSNVRYQSGCARLQ